MTTFVSPKSEISLQFLGAAETVTGSKFLLRAMGKTVLVDCGLFQGLKKWRLLNWNSLPADVSSIDVILLTHGHLDHVGYLPRLISSGFRGEIWGTAPTLDIAKIILYDSARIQQEDAHRAGVRKFSRHKNPIPLYTEMDVDATIGYFVVKSLDSWFKIGDGIECRFRYNGHILGSTFIELEVGKKRIVFSGDLGRNKDMLLNPPEKPERADILVVEGTYGDRLHPDNSEHQLLSVINDAMQKQGTIIIPSFAVERTQLLMYFLWQLKQKRKIPDLPIYVDSPMGAEVFQVFYRYPEWHKLSIAQCIEMGKFISVVKTLEESTLLLNDRSPKIVIAGSGMATGGRVLLYLHKYLGDPATTILLVGYQAEGTRGRQLLDGFTEIKLLGKYIQVKAKIENITGLSAHADQKEILEWLNSLSQSPDRIFIVHGEPQAADALRVKISTELGWECEIPQLNATFVIDHE